MATTNLDVVTGERLEQLETLLWNSMKTWVNSNIDTSNIMTVVKNYLDSANREVIGTTGTAKAQAINVAVAAMVSAFEDAGYDMTGIKTSEFADYITRLANSSGVYILGSDDQLYTADEWTALATKPNVVGIDIVCSDGDVVMSIGSTSTSWGTYGLTVPILESYSGGACGTPKKGFVNTRRILAAANPAVMLGTQYAINYVQGTTTDAQIMAADVIFFASEAALIAFAAEQGQTKMNQFGIYKYYGVPNADDPTKWTMKYYGGTGTTFANRISSTPYTDTKSILGSPSAEYCFAYKAYNGDAHQWYEGSVVELSAVYLNKDAVNACLRALGESELATGAHWSSLQNGSTTAYYVELASGSISSNGNKYTSVVVRAFTTR